MSHCKVHLIFKDFKFEPQTQTFCCNFQRNTLEMFFGDQGRWEPSEMSHFRSVVWRDVRVQAGAKSPEPTSSFRRCCGQSCKNQFCRWVELSEPSHWWWSGLTASKLGLLAEPKLTPSSGAIQAKSSNGEAADGAEVRRDQLTRSTIHTSHNHHCLLFSEHPPVKQSARDSLHLQLHSADQAGGWSRQEGGARQRWGESW